MDSQKCLDSTSADFLSSNDLLLSFDFLMSLL